MKDGAIDDQSSIERENLKKRREKKLRKQTVRKNPKKQTPCGSLEKPSKNGTVSNDKFAIERKVNFNVYECFTCHKKFKHRGVYNRHLITHSKEKPFVCEVCGKGFSRKHHMINHQIVHMSSEERIKVMKYKCEECGKMFTRKEYLEQHFHSTVKEKRHICLCCGALFVQKSGLTRHMALHSEKNLKCDVCGKTFNRQDTLRKHQETHKSEKKETCEYCGKSFVLKKYLDKHLLSHSQIRNFACHLCSKQFLHKSDLNRHTLIHSRKWQECSHCLKKFSPKKDIEKHVLSCSKNPANKKVKASSHKKPCFNKPTAAVDKVDSEDYTPNSKGSTHCDEFGLVKFDTVNGKNPHKETSTCSVNVPFLYFF
ncbi:zinc finger protein OZF-like [Palaemon carinicauda]|uniref:zinc finger protein OZF-like n=1 Tax=Palaemon carinicauda TaxID=392227 RepID=UPI0035B6198A